MKKSLAYALLNRCVVQVFIYFRCVIYVSPGKNQLSTKKVKKHLIRSLYFLTLCLHNRVETVYLKYYLFSVNIGIFELKNGKHIGVNSDVYMIAKAVGLLICARVCVNGMDFIHGYICLLFRGKRLALFFHPQIDILMDHAMI